MFQRASIASTCRSCQTLDPSADRPSLHRFQSPHERPCIGAALLAAHELCRSSPLWVRCICACGGSNSLVEGPPGGLAAGSFGAIPSTLCHKQPCILAVGQKGLGRLDPPNESARGTRCRGGYSCRAATRHTRDLRHCTRMLVVRPFFGCADLAHTGAPWHTSVHVPLLMSCGLTPPSSGRPKGRFAPFAPPLMSNVRRHETDLSSLRRSGNQLFGQAIFGAVLAYQVPSLRRPIRGVGCSHAHTVRTEFSRRHDGRVLLAASPQLATPLGAGTSTCRGTTCPCGCATAQANRSVASKARVSSAHIRMAWRHCCVASCRSNRKPANSVTPNPSFKRTCLRHAA